MKTLILIAMFISTHVLAAPRLQSKTEGFDSASAQIQSEIFALKFFAQNWDSYVSNYWKLDTLSASS